MDSWSTASFLASLGQGEFEPNLQNVAYCGGEFTRKTRLGVGEQIELLPREREEKEARAKAWRGERKAIRKEEGEEEKEERREKRRKEES